MGEIFENAIAQELTSHNVSLYYYKNNRIGEIDFVSEINGKVVPIEVKSGKNYKVHSRRGRFGKASIQIIYHRWTQILGGQSLFLYS